MTQHKNVRVDPPVGHNRGYLSQGLASNCTNGSNGPGIPETNRTQPAPKRVKSLFVSDVHLGCHYSYAREFLQFLTVIEPESLYLVGDIIDGRKLKKRWRWPELYSKILSRIAELGKNGTRIIYTPGNHDAFLRDLMVQLPAGLRLPEIEFVEECIHITEDGRRMLVIHGDQFDRHEAASGIVSRSTAKIYDWLLWGNRRWHQWMMPGNGDRNRVSRAFKNRFRRLQQFFGHFQESVSNYARSKGCDGAICGHIHLPKIVQNDNFTYVNTGDWVEHCSALVENQHGMLALVNCDNFDFVDLHLKPPRGSSSKYPDTFVESCDDSAIMPGLNIPVRDERLLPQEVG